MIRTHNPWMHDLVPVYRSASRKACEERAFVLAAVHIPSQLILVESGFALGVESPQAGLAAHHLWQYENEQRQRSVDAARAAAQGSGSRFPHAWTGSLVYVVLLSMVMLAVVQGWGPADLFTRGDLDSALVRKGEWWRAVTALTLHLDIVHLVSNLGAGAAVGYFASRQFGAGTAWLLVVVAASLSNLAEGWLGGGTHRSVGASTAVFAALGLLAAHAWRSRRTFPQRWAWRWAPLVAGVVLLGLLGSAGEGTDLFAHALGFVMGMLGGVLVSQAAAAGVIRRVPQWGSGSAALGLIVMAWAQALGTAPHL
ncbi:MAG: rhomboid family intramembrane serine protease [Steroidobacteraceae bacterium]